MISKDCSVMYQRVYCAGTSMQPVIKEGAAVYYEKVSFCEVHIGDIVIFNDAPGHKTSTIHRVVRKHHTLKKDCIVTKGDASNEADSLKISEERLTGRVVIIEQEGRKRNILGIRYRVSGFIMALLSRYNLTSPLIKKNYMDTFLTAFLDRMGFLEEIVRRLLNAKIEFIYFNSPSRLDSGMNSASAKLPLCRGGKKDSTQFFEKNWVNPQSFKPGQIRAVWGKRVLGALEFTRNPKGEKEEFRITRFWVKHLGKLLGVDKELYEHAKRFVGEKGAALIEGHPL